MIDRILIFPVIRTNRFDQEMIRGVDKGTIPIPDLPAPSVGCFLVRFHGLEAPVVQGPFKEFSVVPAHEDHVTDPVGTTARTLFIKQVFRKPPGVNPRL